MTRDQARQIYLNFVTRQFTTIEDEIDAMIDVDTTLGMYELDDEPKETE